MAREDTYDIDAERHLAEASSWRVALFEADLETTEGFESWLALDPRHEDAWRRVSAPWDRFGDDAMEPELIAARRDALERAQRQRQRRFSRVDRWRWSGIGLAAAVLAAVVVTTFLGLGVWQATHVVVYETALGERRTITLADGSHVDLDSNSELKVRLLGKGRTLELLRGQARFQVAHDASRPFTVRARDKTVVATGTSFNVDMLGANVIVTLIEGRVSILQERPSVLPIFGLHGASPVLAKLVPGEQLVAQLQEPYRVGVVAAPPIILEKASIDRATSWEFGQLVFDNEPLSSVVPRVARYSNRPLVVDQTAAGLRLSGVFDAGDVATFVDAVQRVLPVTSEAGEDGALHLRKRGG